MEGTAASLANLDTANGTIDISATSKNFIDSVASGGNLMGKVGVFIPTVVGIALNSTL